jgi:hypothetical protein
MLCVRIVQPGLTVDFLGAIDDVPSKLNLPQGHNNYRLEIISL